MKPNSPQGRGVSGDFIVRKKRVAEPPKPKPIKPATTTPVRDQKVIAPPKKANTRWKQYKLWFFDMWYPIVISVGVGIIVCLVLGFQIGSLTKGLSTPEQQYIASVKSGKELLLHPSFLIHKLPTYTLFKFGVERVAYYRLVSAAIAAIAVLSGFYILRKWYSVRVSILGSWLALISAWTLHTARLATTDASFLLLAPLLWMAVWMYNTERRQYAMAALFGVSILCFYQPGFMWLVIGALFWQRKTILKELSQVKLWFKIAAVFVVIIGLSPLVYATTQNPRELLLIAGLPTTLPNISTMFHNLINIPLYLFLRGPDDPVRWLGRLPLLDIFSAAMLVLGLYGLRYHMRLVRAQLLMFSALLLTILITAGGVVTITALLPIIYLLIAGGIAFMLQQWFAVFPRNPIARSIGTSIITVLILLVSYYHISHYFIAWPQAPATKAVFGQSLLK